MHNNGMQQINLLYRAAESFSRYQEYIVRKLAASSLIENVVVISRSDDIPDELDNVFEYKSEIGWLYQYRYTKEYQESEALSKELLESVLPYMATAMAIASRDTNYDIYTAYESRRLVYISLRYWNHIIKKHRINCMLFSYVPHTLHEYVIYMLAKAYGIVTIVYSSTHIPRVFTWGASIESVGDCIGEYYKAKKSEVIEREELLSYLDRVISSQYGSKRSPSELTAARRNAKIELDRFFNPTVFARRLYRAIIPKGSSDCLPTHSRRYGKKYIYDVGRSALVRLHQHGVGYYDRRAVEPDFSVPYIYFGLQLTPEATTLPMGGVFDDQLLSVRILAAAAQKCGIRLYVKEHYVQPRRDRYFYEELFAIENVTCIKTSVSSMPLIINALAVSTQTGSCILEGFVSGKPSLVFGECFYWKGLPGLYQIGSVEECVHAIDEIISGRSEPITNAQVLQYFNAIEHNSISYIAYGSSISENEANSIGVEELAEEASVSYLLNIESAKRGGFTGDRSLESASLWIEEELE